MDAPPPAPPPPSLPPPAAPTGGADRTFPMLCHLSAFLGFLVPLGNIWGPLVVWLVKREHDPEVDAHGKESLNFEISITIYMVVSAILILVLVGILLLIGLTVFWFVVVIIASIRANSGEYYRYPLTIRFIN